MTFKIQKYSDLPARIEGERVVLRPLSHFDAPAMSRLGGDYAVASQTAAIPSPQPLLAAEFAVMSIEAHARAGLVFPYPITLDGNEMIGMISLSRKSLDSVSVIGYWVGRPYWRKGYGYDAAKALIQSAVKHLGVTRIHAKARKDNFASQALLNKLGFKFTGVEYETFIMAQMIKKTSLGLSLDVYSAEWLERPLALHSQILPFRQNQVIRSSGHNCGAAPKIGAVPIRSIE